MIHTRGATPPTKRAAVAPLVAPPTFTSPRLVQHIVLARVWRVWFALFLPMSSTAHLVLPPTDLQTQRIRKSMRRAIKAHIELTLTVCSAILLPFTLNRVTLLSSIHLRRKSAPFSSVYAKLSAQVVLAVLLLRDLDALAKIFDQSWTFSQRTFSHLPTPVTT